MGHTRQVTTYGRKNRRFIKVYDEDHLPSPAKKSREFDISDDSVVLIEGSSVEHLPRTRAPAQESRQTPTGKRREAQRLARDKALSIIAHARQPLTQKQVEEDVPPSKKRLKKPQASISRPPRLKRDSIEIVVLDRKGEEVSYEKRALKQRPVGALLDRQPERVSRMSFASPRKHKSSLKRHQSPLKRSKKLIIISSDEDTDEEDVSTDDILRHLSPPPNNRPPASIKLTSTPEKPSPLFLSPSPSPRHPPSNRHSSSGVWENVNASSVRPRAPKTSLTRTSPPHPAELSVRVNDALQKLPPHVLASFALSGNLEEVLPHLSPQTQEWLEPLLRAQHPVKRDVHTHLRVIPAADFGHQEIDLTVELQNLTLHPRESSPSRSHTDGETSWLEAETSVSFVSTLSDIPPLPSPLPLPIEYTPLSRLLNLCGQDTSLDFGEFIAAFKANGAPNVKRAKLKKIGEASFSEVFGLGDVVVKIVPLLLAPTMSSNITEEEVVDLPCCSLATDVEKEILITREMGGAHIGFVKLLRTVIVQGQYPSSLLQLWDEYQELKGSENIRPDVLPQDTHFALLVLPHAGVDLESYVFPTKTSWRAAFTIMLQVIRALAVAEDSNRFEHRDLHWGQVLIKDVPDKPSEPVVTIIDFGLSRMEADGTTYYTDFEEAIFQGEGDYQFEIYRHMRQVNDDWESYTAVTNVMWLHYLADKLINFKGLVRPVIGRVAKGKAKSAGQLAKEEELGWYETLKEIHQYLGSAFAQTPNSKGRRKTIRKTPATERDTPPQSAIEVLKWMVEDSKEE